MKKLILPIIGVTVLLISLVMLQPQTYSQSNLLYTDPINCIQETANEMATMKAGWLQNENSLMDQEKATSKKTDEAFESMRTYRCWLDYLCETVLSSANAAPELLTATVTREHVRSIPGCAHPEDIQIPGTELKLLKKCVSGETLKSKVVQEAATNYRGCKRITNLDFAPLEGKDGEPANANDKAAVEQFKNQSSAFIALERLLKQNSSDQKNKALQQKLGSILIKMRVMEAHATFLKTQVQKLFDLMPCFAPKCT